MKKISLALVMFLLLTVIPLVSAETEKDAGITPKSPFYFLDVTWDNMGFVFSQGANKVALGLEIAEERLAEMKKVNTSKALEKINRNREKILQKVQERANTEEVRDMVREKLEHHTNVLQQVKEKVSEEAKFGLDTALENSKKMIKGLSVAEKTGRSYRGHRQIGIS